MAIFRASALNLASSFVGASRQNFHLFPFTRLARFHGLRNTSLTSIQLAWASIQKPIGGRASASDCWISADDVIARSIILTVMCLTR